MQGTIEREFKEFTHLPKSPGSVSSKISRLLPSDKQVDTCVGMLESVSVLGLPWIFEDSVSFSHTKGYSKSGSLKPSII